MYVYVLYIYLNILSFRQFILRIMIDCSYNYERNTHRRPEQLLFIKINFNRPVFLVLFSRLNRQITIFVNFSLKISSVPSWFRVHISFTRTKKYYYIARLLLHDKWKTSKMYKQFIHSRTFTSSKTVFIVRNIRFQGVKAVNFHGLYRTDTFFSFFIIIYLFFFFFSYRLYRKLLAAACAFKP